ncbi:MAG: acetyl/propionyl/methylcrotonyl-CoA carboxylase subunit alpha [Myxococcota bacterium]
MGKPLRKVLVANRGEIARRIMRSCRDMGIATVAVFSDADENMPFVRDADEAVRIGPPPSGESYLRIDRILEAAARTGADAVHPGYGFLSENAELAQACADRGVVFIGPTPDAIRAMGSKKEAKRIAADADVPVVPGYDGAKQDIETLVEKAREVGFPLMLKASAGGGGKGMRIVREDKNLEDMIESAKREAKSSFGDDTMLIEKYIESPRHVEIQILGDAHGNLVHLFERECSIQRRHQKIIEESPSPALNPELRARMGDAAVRVGQAIGYRNAGTVEFILAPDGSFYFLEVNTRLQVEHPVTECVTGVDLVRQQIRVAQGEELGVRQEDLRQQGAAVEVRIYAEDPSNGFLPQSGPIVDWHLPPMEGLREDGGVESGSHVGIHYDPMLAKIITWDHDRTGALRRMVRALQTLSVQGITTNRAFLLKVLQHPKFVAGEIDTHFIETHMKGELEVEVPEALVRRAAVVATLADHERRRVCNPTLPHVPSGWRNNPWAPQWVEYEGPAGDVRVEYWHRGRGAFDFTVGEWSERVQLVACDEERPDVFELRAEEGGVRHRMRVVRSGGVWHVQDAEGAAMLVEKPRFPDPSAEAVAGGCVAPMPGKIIQLRVEPGQRVEQGDVLVVMEAMKMEHTVAAPSDGEVSAVHVAEGDQVDGGALLVVIDEG